MVRVRIVFSIRVRGKCWFRFTVTVLGSVSVCVRGRLRIKVG